MVPRMLVGMLSRWGRKGRRMTRGEDKDVGKKAECDEG